MTAKIIAIEDGPIPTLADARELETGEIGEIIVCGPVVTKTYDQLPDATLRAKIRESGPAEETLWHRMGDCGYLDGEGRLWFCGRKAERVETASGTLHTEICEAIFRGHPQVGRCALIGLGERGAQRPALVIEPKPASVKAAWALARELHALARQHPATASIETIFFREKFPVDVRHNAKIHRLALAQWAATAKAYAVVEAVA